MRTELAAALAEISARLRDREIRDHHRLGLDRRAPPMRIVGGRDGASRCAARVQDEGVDKASTEPLAAISAGRTFSRARLRRSL